MKQILNNLDFSFCYKTLLNDGTSLNNNGNTNFFDFEDGLIDITYNIPKDERSLDWITGWRFERVDNDNNFGISLGEDKINRFMIRTKYGNFGYQEGTQIDALTGAATNINNFFYRGRLNKKYYFGNNILGYVGTNFFIDTDANYEFELNSRIIKYFKTFDNNNDYTALSSSIEYKIFSNEIASDIKSRLNLYFYPTIYYNNWYATVDYINTDFTFKGPNVTAEKGDGLGIFISKYSEENKNKTPLNTNMQIGWQESFY